MEIFWCLDAFRGKYGDKWIMAYEEAKISVNKMGPEAKYKASRRSSSGVDSRDSTQMNEMNETSVQIDKNVLSETVL